MSRTSPARPAASGAPPRRQAAEAPAKRYSPTSSTAPICHWKSWTDATPATITPAGRPSSNAATSGRTYAVCSSAAVTPTGRPTPISNTSSVESGANSARPGVFPSSMRASAGRMRGRQSR